MKPKHILTSLTLLLTALTAGSQLHADMLVANATIYTLDADSSVAEAMVITDGKIVATGSQEELNERFLVDVLLDADGGYIYPGFIDAHCHFLGYGLTLNQVDLRGTKSFEEAVERIVAFDEEYDPAWITGRGWDHTDWPEKQFPSKDTLDLLFPDKPVFVRRVDGHAGLANQKALDLAGITPSTTVDGGTVVVEDGKLTGLLIDTPMDLVQAVIPEPSIEEKTRALQLAQENCFEVGLTTVHDAGISKDDVLLIDSLQRIGELKMRIYAMLSDNDENLDYFLPMGPYKTERLNVSSVKFYADGALGSRGACLLKPYEDVVDEEHFGKMFKDRQYYLDRAQRVYDAGYQMNTHCIGDSANRVMLSVYEEIIDRNSPDEPIYRLPDLRWRIEHAQVVNPKDMKAFMSSGIIPSVQPTHATSDMKWAYKRLGMIRLEGAYAYKDLLGMNGWLPLGTDFPVEQIDPMLTFYAAVTRKSIRNAVEEPFREGQALTRWEALYGMTLWAAKAGFEEDEKGSLEPGKMADFVILDRDILECPEEEILDVDVIDTYVAGDRVYVNRGDKN